MKNKQILFERKGNTVKFGDGTKVNLTGAETTSALYVFGGGIRYLGKVQKGDDVDLIKGCVRRNGEVVFPIHQDIGHRYGYHKTFYVHVPSLTPERVVSAHEKLCAHMETIILPRWRKAISKISGDGAYYHTGNGYYLHYTKSKDGVSIGSFQLKVEDLSRKYSIPTDESLIIGREIRRAEERLEEVNSLISLFNNLVLETVVEPQLPKRKTHDDICSVQAGKTTFLFQAKLFGSKNCNWNLIGQSRNINQIKIGF